MSESGHIARVNSATEARNQRTLEIDTLPTLGVLRLLNEEDHSVAAAVQGALPALQYAVDMSLERFEAGGSIHYFGAGTSGRIGMMDAAEIPPTFSVSPDRFVAHHAGGNGTAERAVEAAEDDGELGKAAAASLKENDVAIGLTASGRTPYVRGALEAARAAGAFTVLISSHPSGEIAELDDIHVFLDTGPEAIAGSTRLKAGTAQKLALNSFSTALMIRLGKTYSNLMVDVAPANTKLRSRVLGILESASGATEAECSTALAAADGDTKTALVDLITGVGTKAAREAIRAAGGRVRGAIGALDPNTSQGSHSESKETQHGGRA